MGSLDSATHLTRYYIDVRPLIPVYETPDSLPLLSTLTQDERESITRFFRPADRLLSLGSALLKRLFIHRQARIPWSEVHISRTPKPHRRPYWSTPEGWKGTGGLEFNVSHQAGLVALLGCRTSNATPPQALSPDGVLNPEGITISPVSGVHQGQVRLGVDIACTNEDKRTPTDIVSQAKLNDWVDVFEEMFSEREREDMKHEDVTIPDGLGGPGVPLEITAKLRRFYAYWALKEAYIKMVGEGLLAGWLQELEFLDVQAPPPVMKVTSNGGTVDADEGELEVRKWSQPWHVRSDVMTLFRHKEITDVQMMLMSYEDDFIIATATRGVRPENARAALQWQKVDIERDVRPCAEGRCDCLS